MTIPVLLSPPSGLPEIWGIPAAERTRRQLARLEQLAGDATGLILRGDVVYDDAVLRGMMEKIGCLLVSETGEPLAAYGMVVQRPTLEDWLQGSQSAPEGLTRLTPANAGFAYNRRLRKRAPPQCHIVTKENAGHIEWLLYKASYKGVTDIVTKYAWPVPAFYVSRLCARLGILPNMVTTLGAILTTVAVFLFWKGEYGPGLIAAWLMTFLDTVDGKLARCTLTSSHWGGIFDHAIDIVHPPFWYIAWGLGLAAVGLDAHGWLVPGLVTLFAAYAVVRLCEMYFIRRFGFHIHVWRRGDSFFRSIVARRNPNMIILSLSWLAGRPDIGLMLVILWTLCAIPVHLVQIAQAEAVRRQGQVPVSWLSV